jgi:hypothetical protein
VVADVGIAGTRLNADGPRAGREQCRLADTKPFAGFQHVARAIGALLRIVDIGIVGDAVAHRVIERDRTRLLAGHAFDDFLSEAHDAGIVAVDEIRRREKFIG